MPPCIRIAPRRVWLARMTVVSTLKCHRTHGAILRDTGSIWRWTEAVQNIPVLALEAGAVNASGNYLGAIRTDLGIDSRPTSLGLYG